MAPVQWQLFSLCTCAAVGRCRTRWRLQGAKEFPLASIAERSLISTRGWGSQEETQARGVQVTMTWGFDDLPPERQLALRFLALPFRHQVDAAKASGFEGFCRLADHLATEALFRWAGDNESRLAELWDATEHHYPDPRPNPFPPSTKREGAGALPLLLEQNANEARLVPSEPGELQSSEVRAQRLARRALCLRAGARAERAARHRAECERDNAEACQDLFAETLTELAEELDAGAIPARHPAQWAAERIRRVLVGWRSLLTCSGGLKTTTVYKSSELSAREGRTSKSKETVGMSNDIKHLARNLLVVPRVGIKQPISEPGKTKALGDYHETACQLRAAREGSDAGEVGTSRSDSTWPDAQDSGVQPSGSPSGRHRIPGAVSPALRRTRSALECLGRLSAIDIEDIGAARQPVGRWLCEAMTLLDDAARLLDAAHELTAHEDTGDTVVALMIQMPNGATARVCCSERRGSYVAFEFLGRAVWFDLTTGLVVPNQSPAALRGWRVVDVVEVDR